MARFKIIIKSSKFRNCIRLLDHIQCVIMHNSMEGHLLLLIKPVLQTICAYIYDTTLDCIFENKGQGWNGREYNIDYYRIYMYLLWDHDLICKKYCRISWFLFIYFRNICNCVLVLSFHREVLWTALRNQTQNQGFSCIH